jgi:DNA-binding HxlR family transcriptional regulator
MFLKTKHDGYNGAMKRTPLPHSRARGSETGQALMAALDLLGRRWSLRVLWELRSGPVGARSLLEKCEGLSSSVLYERLRELSESDLITRSNENKYQLTALGASLGMAINPLDRWATNWARRVEEK